MSLRTMPVLAAAGLAAAIAGCGSGPGATASGHATRVAHTTATASRAATASHRLTERMTDYAFAPKHAVARHGRVRITAPNAGRVVHELVVLRTNADPAHLPMRHGRVDERTSVGEISDVAPGRTKSRTLRLTPGRYVMVCALPGHYASGMYGSLTVR